MKKKYWKPVIFYADETFNTERNEQYDISAGCTALLIEENNKAILLFDIKNDDDETCEYQKVCIEYNKEDEYCYVRSRHAEAVQMDINNNITTGYDLVPRLSSIERSQCRDLDTHVCYIILSILYNAAPQSLPISVVRKFTNEMYSECLEKEYYELLERVFSLVKEYHKYDVEELFNHEVLSH